MFRNIGWQEPFFVGFAALILWALGVGIVNFLRPAAPADSPFPADTRTLVRDCTSINLTVREYEDDVDADGILHCLYNAGYTLELRGDPIIRPTPSR